VSVIIPAYNEAERITATIRAAAGLPRVCEVVVVDDGSRDGTADVARDAGARVIRLDRNRGKGAALMAGADAVGSEILLLLDSDLGETASRASAMVDPVLCGRADMTVGVLPAPAPGAAGLGAVVRIARWAVRSRTGCTLRAPLSGQRCLRRETFNRCRPLARRFGVEAAMTLDLLRAGLRLEEVPVPLSHRATGRGLGGWLHRARQLADVVLALAPRLLRGAAPSSASVR
jgi:glycosyltransferase involved in cell wall biosynthesis